MDMEGKSGISREQVKKLSGEITVKEQEIDRLNTLVGQLVSDQCKLALAPRMNKHFFSLTLGRVAYPSLGVSPTPKPHPSRTQIEPKSQRSWNTLLGSHGYLRVPEGT